MSIRSRSDIISRGDYMIPFLFAVHSHQPVGNFGWVFEDALDGCYQPFLEILDEFPEVKISLHYSGCLLEWIEQNRPQHVDLIKKLVGRGQVEIMGGGFYEPIFTAIPARDLRAQISSYLDHLEHTFGQRPKGIWLTERAWDPALPPVLSDLGVKYTLVDDSHFRYAGIEPENAWGPFVAEREGKSVIIFPIDKMLRYLIPFHEPEEALEYIIQRAADTPGFVACYGDDGEKFGVWPGTREHVFENGWLKSFFQALEKESDRIRTVKISDFLESASPRSRAYIPPASYEEMMEWVLPPDMGERLEDYTHEIKEQGRLEDLAPFVRGGHWDMFLSKYEESNRMQKRMLLASERIAKKPKASRKARAALYRSQCNCAYWHGVFGGLYLNYLRHAIYQQILEAEALAGPPTKRIRMEKRDYDLDGSEEILVFAPKINAFVAPASGGALAVLEYPAARFSLSNVMARRRETYHRKLAQASAAAAQGAPATIHETVTAKEEGLENYLVEDRFPRMSLQDHLVPSSLTLEEIEKERTIELGRFAGEPYALGSAKAGRIELSRPDRCGEVPLRVEKVIEFEPGKAGLSASYRVASEGDRPLSVRFCVEWNLTLLSGDAPGRYYLVDGEKPDAPLMGGRGTHPGARRVELINEDDGFAAAIEADPPFMLFRYPIECVSQSESGFERTYQGSCLWLTWPLRLGAGEEFRFTIDLALRDL